jgi:hypothetical protein
MIGEFEEQDFIEASSCGRLPSDCYYWQEGMEDWKPIAEYRALAKTQRISFVPPMKRTVRIDMNALGEADAKLQPAKTENVLARFWKRLTGK